MNEPPDKDHSGNDHQAEGLVATECMVLIQAALFFCDLLFVRLD